MDGERGALREASGMERGRFPLRWGRRSPRATGKIESGADCGRPFEQSLHLPQSFVNNKLAKWRLPPHPHWKKSLCEAKFSIIGATSE